MYWIICILRLVVTYTCTYDLCSDLYGLENTLTWARIAKKTRLEEVIQKQNKRKNAERRERSIYRLHTIAV